MAQAIATFLKKYPLLIGYAQKGLINFTALARFVKEENKEIDPSASLAAVGMDLRRYIATLPPTVITPIDFSPYALQTVLRTNINEFVLTKNAQNRQACLRLVQQISRTKHFVSLVEGEKEIVVITDHSLTEILKDDQLKNIVTHQTKDLGLISVNFPIELRKVPGIYHMLTALLVEANIAIQSFHTIGGEILLLVNNYDLLRTQAILQRALS